MAQHSGDAGGRVEQATQHFECGGLPGAVWPKETNDLARRDREGDAVDRARLQHLAPDQALQGATQARLLAMKPVGLDQVDDMYRRHRSLAFLDKVSDNLLWLCRWRLTPCPVMPGEGVAPQRRG